MNIITLKSKLIGAYSVNWPSTKTTLHGHIYDRRIYKFIWWCIGHTQLTSSRPHSICSGRSRRIIRSRAPPSWLAINVGSLRRKKIKPLNRHVIASWKYIEKCMQRSADWFMSDIEQFVVLVMASTLTYLQVKMALRAILECSNPSPHLTFSFIPPRHSKPRKLTGVDTHYATLSGPNRIGICQTRECYQPIAEQDGGHTEAPCSNTTQRRHLKGSTHIFEVPNSITANTARHNWKLIIRDCGRCTYHTSWNNVYK